MASDPLPIVLTEEQATDLSLRAGQVFCPRTPIGSRELFAGRWNEIKLLADTVAQVGLHAILYGERGAGKTSLANMIPSILHVFDKSAKPPRSHPRIAIQVNAVGADTFSSVWAKALDKVAWNETSEPYGFSPKPGLVRTTVRQAYGLTGELSIDDVCRMLTGLVDAVFVIDEFDRLPRKQVAMFTDLIKTLSDNAVRATVILVGVARTVDDMVRDHASISRAIMQIPLRRMSVGELREILGNAERQLGVAIDPAAGERIVILSQGLPHYTHLMGLQAVRAACARHSALVTSADVGKAFEQAVRNADQTISTLYAGATHSAQPGALYAHVLLACAMAAARGSEEGEGYFQPASLVDPLTAILKRSKPVEISMFNKHLGEFCEDKRAVLERTGHPRAYRYRFRDPLMPPFVLMRGVADGTIHDTQLDALMPAGDGPP